MKKICYYYNDVLHNSDGPAVIFGDGHKLYYFWDCLIKEELSNGTIINYDSPKVEKNENFIKYYNYGKLHSNEGPAVIYSNGDKYWYQYGKIHRENDLPAIEYSSGEKRWFKYGILHRDEEKGPAIIFSEKEYEFYHMGIVHRKNGPAVIREYKKAWMVEGLYHRDEREGPAITYENGDFMYYFKGELHRSNNQPAIKIYDNFSYYYKGNLHRDDGPAVDEMTKKIWYTHGLKHRNNNLPAEIRGSGHLDFYYKGERHSTRGPSTIITNEYIIANNLEILKQSPLYNPKYGYKEYCLFGIETAKNKYYDFIFTIRSKIFKFKKRKRIILISEIKKKFNKDISELISKFVY
jgi:hypothetical protein